MAVRPFRHLGLKLLALGLAVLLWIAVSGEATVERGLSVPLELQQVPPNLELLTKPPSTVDVRVRGGAGALSRLEPGDIVAVLDLRSARPGQRLFPLSPDQVRVPFGIEVVQITPTTVALAFETSATKAVPVVPSLDGRPAPGYVVGRVTTDPPAVEVAGPESAVRRAAAAITEPISIAGSTRRVRGTVTVGVLDSTLRLRSARTAIVDVEILPAPLERTLHGLPVHWRNLAPNLTVRFTPATVDVAVRGSREALDGLASDDVRAYVDVGRMGPGEYDVPVHAESTREVGISRIEPPTVRARILQ